MIYDKDQAARRALMIAKHYADGGDVAGLTAPMAAPSATQSPAQPTTVYHGSPHQFSQFDLGKIGTGEGAQVYGHGLYVAEHPDVAESYVGPAAWSYKGVPAENLYDKANDPKRERGLKTNADWDKLNAERGFWEQVTLGQHPRNIIQERTNNPDDFGEQEVAYAKSLDPNKFTRHSGHMYEVSMTAPTDRMLNWDKPVAEQHPLVRKAALEAAAHPDIKPTGRLGTKLRWFQEGTEQPHAPLTGAELHYVLGNMTEGQDAARATEYLKSHGVPGIKYLDQNSRARGVGTHNYVVFDPSHLNVVKHYAEGGTVGTDANPPGDDPRQITPSGFYSYGAEAANALPQAKGSPQQMLGMLQNRGVKPDEIENAGAADAFAGQPSVTRGQLAQHFQSQLPDIRETQLGGDNMPEPDIDPAKKAAWLKQRAADNAVGMGDIQSPRDFDLAEAHIQHQHLRNAEADYEGEEAYNPNFVRQFLKDPNQRLRLPTKFEEYTTPGATNYRELLLHTPTGPQRYDAFDQRMVDKYGAKAMDPSIWTPEERAEGKRLNAAPRAYMSSHWEGTPNVLAHLRMSDRTDPEGKKVLHLEELQSDWGQEGRKKGFEGKPETEYRVINNRSGFRTDPFARREEAEAYHASLPPSVQGNTRIQPGFKPGKAGLPNGPYVGSTQGWTDLGLKRALIEAARGGYDKMVWTPGDEQVNRYDLRKQINHIMYKQNPDNTYRLSVQPVGRGPMQNMGENISHDKLEDLVGKDIAGHMINGRGEEINIGGNTTSQPPDKWRKLAGGDLAVGGEGMKSFYDKILPAQLGKIVKKLDPSVQPKMHTADVEGEPVHMPGIDITPKMRETILKGLPAFYRGGEVDERPARAAPKPADGRRITDHALRTANQYGAHLPDAVSLARQIMTRGRP